MNKDELLNYMPHWYDGVYEMEELLKAQGASLSKFDSDRERTLFNEFVIKTDEKGISVFEDQYGIIPDPGDSLELRQQRVLMRMLPPLPITLRRLQQIFKSLQIPASLSRNAGKRLLKVTSWSGELSSSQQKLITSTLNIYLPANMQYVYRTWSKSEIGHAYVGSAVQAKAKTSTFAEVLSVNEIDKKLYEYKIWQATDIKPGAYIGTRAVGKVTTAVQAERRNL